MASPRMPNVREDSELSALLTAEFSAASTSTVIDEVSLMVDNPPLTNLGNNSGKAGATSTTITISTDSLAISGAGSGLHAQPETLLDNNGLTAILSENTAIDSNAALADIAQNANPVNNQCDAIDHNCDVPDSSTACTESGPHPMHPMVPQSGGGQFQKKKTSKIFQPTVHNTPCGIAGRDWKEHRPDGTTDEFGAYFRLLAADKLKSLQERSKKAKQGGKSA
ncbi:hypothetical protein EW026_g8014 [Hermanssonia centrifuga]|uniref:Uncharacterized protein n=1 Tax=Hermanssonia centrifuga TaxID=98765 RepID=A0A4S4K5V1_9APHY|nr:hypothetical protein EW026_g8014 [Hermanssonia centrifuga]